MTLYEQLQSNFDIYKVEPSGYGSDVFFTALEDFVRCAGLRRG